jgi:amino acid permease
MANLFAKKPLSLLCAEAAETGEHSLKRTLGVFQLTSLGVGAVIGAGIFVMSGLGASMAGPGLMLSFILSGTGCAFAALCYAEFAAMIPLAGSAYTYAYATLGELFAWIIGWDLTLEYAMGQAPSPRDGQTTLSSCWKFFTSECRFGWHMTIGRDCGSRKAPLHGKWHRLPIRR